MKTDLYADNNRDGIPDAFSNRLPIVDILNSDETSYPDDLTGFSAMSVNGYPYKRVLGEWVPDGDVRREQLAREATEQRRKDELVFACRSRVLTDAEMGEIATMGIDILIRMKGGMSECYKQEELEHRLNELLLQQFRLRRAEPIEPASTTKAEGR